MEGQSETAEMEVGVGGKKKRRKEVRKAKKWSDVAGRGQSPRAVRQHYGVQGDDLILGGGRESSRRSIHETSD